MKVTDIHPVHKSHSRLSFLLTAIAGLFSMPVLCWAFEPHGPCLLWSHEKPAQGLHSLHWMVWQTEDQTAVTSLKTSRVNMFQSQNLLCFFELIYSCFTILCEVQVWVFHGALEGKETACKAGDQGSIPGSGRSRGEGNGNLLQDSCLENSQTEEPGGLQPMGLQWVRHSWGTNTFTFH